MQALDGCEHPSRCLHKQISELTTELHAIKTEAAIQKLVNVPALDSSKVVTEMQSQLAAKDRRLKTLEQENLNYKRNQMIQAVVFGPSNVLSQFSRTNVTHLQNVSTGITRTERPLQGP